MNNEEKILSYLENLQNEMVKMNGRMDKMDSRMDKMQETINDTHHTVAKLEAETVPQIRGLFDAIKMNYELVNDKIEPRLSQLEISVNKLQVEVIALKLGKLGKIE